MNFEGGWKLERKIGLWQEMEHLEFTINLQLQAAKTAGGPGGYGYGYAQGYGIGSGGSGSGAAAANTPYGSYQVLGKFTSNFEVKDLTLKLDT